VTPRNSREIHFAASSFADAASATEAAWKSLFSGFRRGSKAVAEVNAFTGNMVKELARPGQP
jgi:hypothetical protein